MLDISREQNVYYQTDINALRNNELRVNWAMEMTRAIVP